MTPETALYQLAGVRKESPKVKWYAIVAFEIFSKLDLLLHKTQIQGALPTEGPGLVISNHTGSWDIAKGYIITKTGKRIMRGIARETLLNPKLKESEEVLERTGKTSDPLTNAPRLVRNFIAAVLNGVDAIAVPRGAQTLSALRPTLKACTETFITQRLASIFIQETRVKDNDLRNVMKGPAFLAKMHPDIPIYSTAIYSKNSPHKIRIGKPFTVNQAKLDPHFIKDLDQTTALTIYIADKIANLSEEDILLDWFAEKRQLYINAALGINTSAKLIPKEWWG